MLILLLVNKWKYCHTVSVTRAILVADMVWSNHEHCAFIIEEYFKNNYSVITTQDLPHRCFNLD